MALRIPWEVVDETDVDDLREARAMSPRDRKEHSAWEAPTGAVTDDLLKHLAKAAEAVGHGSLQKAVAAIVDARAGIYRPIPNLNAVSEALLAYLRHDVIDGWLYVGTRFGRPQPVLVTDIRLNDNLSTVTFEYELHTVKGRTSAVDDAEGELRAKLTLGSGKLRSALPETLLRRIGARKETAELKAQYLQWERSFIETTSRGPGVAGKVTGLVYAASEYEDKRVDARYVISDTEGDPLVLAPGDPRLSCEGLMPGAQWLSRVPNYLVVEVFDPVADAPCAAHVSHFAEHEYDPDVLDSLVLPPAHRKLLDMLTSDSTSHIDDVLEDRSAGNLVLAAGLPGTGKTLTAHAYAEALGKPLYAVDSGVLLAHGANQIRSVLAEVFNRCRRWGAVLLLDEVDVIVAKRGPDIAMNNLTAGFLRLVEGFDQLTFMTTNRLQDVDDAVLSRCAAILRYEAPEGETARKAWRVHADLHRTPIDDQLIENLVNTMPGTTPRDMRQILRLAVQTAAHEDRPIDIGLIHEVAQYRGWEPSRHAKPEHVKATTVGATAPPKALTLVPDAGKGAIDARSAASSKSEADGEAVFRDLMLKIAAVNQIKGWYELERSFPEDLALVHSEISEALEAYRLGHEPGVEIFEAGGKPVGVPSEIADTIIRLLDICWRYNIPIYQAILGKVDFNSTRDHRHGGKRL